MLLLCFYYALDAGGEGGERVRHLIIHLSGFLGQNLEVLYDKKDYTFLCLIKEKIREEKICAFHLAG